MKLKPHPLSELIPPMSETDFASLKADIALKKFLTDPIVLLDGLVLDGRHRAEICHQLKIKPPTINFDPKWGSPLAYVYSKANRRNLTDSQRTTAAALMKLEREKDSRRNRKGRGQIRDEIGALFGVSGRYVSDAEMLLKRDRKLFDQVFRGELPLSHAKRQLIRKTRRAQVQMALESASATPRDCRMICGDAIEQMETFPAGHFRLIFTDPVYNLGFKYDSDPTRDALPAEKYLAWCQEWINAAARVLVSDGTMMILICEEWQHHFGLMLQRARLHLRRLIVWYETFGQNCSHNFNRTCRFLYYTTKSADDFVFDETALLTDSARSTRYKDKRAMPGGKNLDALWDISRLQGTTIERVPFDNVPTQLPLSLLSRIVCGLSEPGDRVLDCFAGTGTTGVACVQHGRSFTGIERSKRYAKIAEQRMRLAAQEARA